MDTIKALLLDDEEGNVRTAQQFKPGFRRLGREVEWSFVHTSARAWEVLSETRVKFDLIVVDLLWDRNDLRATQESLGPALIAEARRRFPGAFVLALSGGHTDRQHIFNDARRSGAHLVLRRDEFSHGSDDTNPDQIAFAIQEHLLDGTPVSPVPVEYDVEDPDILGVIDQVGGTATLCRLYSRALEALRREAASVRLGFVAPGASGDGVCAVEATLAGGDVRIHHVLKLSKDSHGLERAAERAVDAAMMVRPMMIVRPEPGYPVGPVNGWYAICTPLQRGAITLREWLARGPGDKAVRDVLAASCTNVVGELQRQKPRENEPYPDLMETPAFRKSRILLAMRELEPALRLREGGGFSQREAIRLRKFVRAFVVEGRLEGVERHWTSRAAPAVLAHRDFHGGNVLVYVSGRPQPVVVDLDSFGLDHWAVDPACLCVDLLLHSVDAGAQSMLFSGFAVWRGLAARIGALTTVDRAVTRHSGTRAALTALNWVTQNLREVCPTIATDELFGKHGWEWNAALATFFLRSTYHLSISPQKRAFALVAAYDQLLAAARGAHAAAAL